MYDEIFFFYKYIRITLNCYTTLFRRCVFSPSLEEENVIFSSKFQTAVLNRKQITSVDNYRACSPPLAYTYFHAFVVTPALTSGIRLPARTILKTRV